jgi:hypothetical protein
MAAVIRRIRFGDGSIRLGPQCFRWHDPYTRSLSFEVERVNVAVIGGLTWTVAPEEYRWVEEAMIAEGLRMAQDRVQPDGSIRRVMLPMPKLKHSQENTP